MQITADASALRAAISQAARLVPSKSTLPILSHVLLDAQGEQLQATATDLEASVTLTVPVAVLTEGRAAVPAKLLADWLASVDGPVTLALQPRHTLQLTAGRVTTTLRGLDPADYPAVQPAGAGVPCTLAADVLRRALDETVYATAPDDSRPVLSGALLRTDGATLELAAADGYRLAVRRVPLERAPETPFMAIVPGKALNELATLCGRYSGRVTILAVPTQNRLEASGEGWAFASRLVEGQFPDYAKIIPRQPTTAVTVPRGELLQALRFAAILARDNASLVRFAAAGDGTLLVSATSPDCGEHAATLAATLEGAPGRVAMSGVYVRQALEALATGQVVLRLSGESSPAVLEAVGGDGPTAVIMPMSCKDWPAASREAVAV